MNNQIINFTFEAQTVRTATNPQGEIYFCLPDVANVLEISRSSDLLQVQKDFVKNETPKKRGMLDPKGVARLSTPTKGGTQQITFISEPNLYRVIFRSNKAEAVKFQNWVFDEVLPSIRKNGTYTTKSTAHDRTPLRQAVTALTAKFGLMHDEAYRLVHQYMGVNSIDEIALDDLPKAVAYVHSLLLSTHNNDQNAFWQMVGLLEHERISGEIRQLNDTINQAERLIRQARVQINQLNTGTGLLYDAFGEQYLPTKVPVLDKAQAFIDRQMAMKKKIGLIS
ncbi:Bro-N domain-containing protein [Moraxella bovis]|uniref:BRO family protein n=1 Tax=Moraxella bovis TaxID=476 RepID=A0AAX3EX29_MORBO|nr:BRO family protein [Moraxella bovis]UZA04497.1 BRO family protein [Moraxella bovis]UZA52565.1 BRO family protein [Moraxella bovis]